MTTEYHQVSYKLRQALQENAKLKATVGELREALIPFAVYGRRGSRDVEVAKALEALENSEWIV